MRQILGFLAAVALSAIAAPIVPAAPVTVPNVTGQHESDAQCALSTAGLRWRFRGDAAVSADRISPCTRPSPKLVPDPKVLAQTPRAGRTVSAATVVVLDDTCLRAFRAPHGHCDSSRSGRAVQRRQLDRSSALWRRRHPRSYTFRIHVGGFPLPGASGPLTIAVRNGRPSNSSSRQLDGYPGTLLNTVPNLFRTIRRALDDPAAGTAMVRYDPRRGFPTSAFIDPAANRVDDEFDWRLDRFRRP